MSPRQVRAGLLLCALLVAGALGTLAAPAPPSASAKPETKSEPASAVAASQSGSQAVAAELAKGGGPVRPAVTPLPAGKRRVAIFDFDDTLKNEGNVVAQDASWAVHAAVANGYEVAIASAGCKKDFVKTFLQRRVAPDIFTDEFFTTPAFQVCQPFKTYSLTPIVQYFGLDNARRCAILFDNAKYNRPYADQTGIGFQWVDNGALEGKEGEVGITTKDWFAGQQMWDKTCPTTKAGAPV